MQPNSAHVCSHVKSGSESGVRGALSQDGARLGGGEKGRREHRVAGRSVHGAERGRSRGKRCSRCLVISQCVLLSCSWCLVISQCVLLSCSWCLVISQCVLLIAFVKPFVVVPPDRNFISPCEEPKGSAHVGIPKARPRAYSFLDVMRLWVTACSRGPLG